MRHFHFYEERVFPNPVGRFRMRRNAIGVGLVNFPYPD
jgi:hypothetical protein